MDESRPSFPQHDLCGPIDADAVPIAVGVQPSAELDDKLAAPVRDPIERPSAALQLGSSMIVYCGTAQEVSEGFAIALCAMGIEANILPLGIAPDTTIPNTEDT